MVELTIDEDEALGEFAGDWGGVGGMGALGGLGGLGALGALGTLGGAGGLGGGGDLGGRAVTRPLTAAKAAKRESNNMMQIQQLRNQMTKADTYFVWHQAATCLLYPYLHCCLGGG